MCAPSPMWGHGQGEDDVIPGWDTISCLEVGCTQLHSDRRSLPLVDPSNEVSPWSLSRNQRLAYALAGVGKTLEWGLNKHGFVPQVTHQVSDFGWVASFLTASVPSFSL